MGSKKIILFIVEGITEQTCLAYVLSKILNSNQIEFAVTNGDITSRAGNNGGNIAARVGDIVKRYASNTFRADDFLEVVHLIDTDGAYINKDKVIDKSNAAASGAVIDKLPYYCDENIIADNVTAIVQRNQQKTEIIDRLLSLNRVWRTIPYSVYYFSCNLDHVLHNERNLPDEKKFRYATAFDKRYGADQEAFLSFIHNPVFAVSGKFQETWSFIKAENYSLKRYSNFHLYFS